MNFISIFFLIILGIWALWMYAIYYHVARYKMPNDMSNKFFWFFVAAEVLLALLFIFYFSGIDWGLI